MQLLAYVALVLLVIALVSRAANVTDVCFWHTRPIILVTLTYQMHPGYIK